MKNYFELSEIPELESIKNKLIEQANEDLNNYTKNLPLTQKTKRLAILVNKYVKMYSMAIKFTQAKGLPQRNMDELFNFTADSVEENQDNGYGIRAKEIAKSVDPNYYSIKTSCFENTLKLIPSVAHSAWFIFYKQGATVHPHAHDYTTMVTHILLDDITDGEFVVKTNGEAKVITKKGDFFSFCTKNMHEVTFTGKKATFLTFSIEMENVG